MHERHFPERERRTINCTSCTSPFMGGAILVTRTVVASSRAISFSKASAILAPRVRSALNECPSRAARCHRPDSNRRYPSDHPSAPTSRIKIQTNIHPVIPANACLLRQAAVVSVGADVAEVNGHGFAFICSGFKDEGRGTWDEGRGKDVPINPTTFNFQPSTFNIQHSTFN